MDDIGAAQTPDPSDGGVPSPPFTRTTRRNSYEEQQLRVVLASVLEPDSVVIDVGAHGGSLLRELMRLAPLGRHVAFEPLPGHTRRLQRLFPQVDVRPVALADETGETTFVRVTSLPSWSGLRRRPYPPHVRDEDLEEITVRVETLDGAIGDHVHPRLVKIDVEGAEVRVLRGARATLLRWRPLLVFEHAAATLATYGTSPSELHHLVADEHGYRIFDLAGDGPYDVGEFDAAVRAHRWINWLGRP